MVSVIFVNKKVIDYQPLSIYSSFKQLCESLIEICNYFMYLNDYFYKGYNL